MTPEMPHMLHIAPDVRAALLYALWHHQGASSPIGQPIREILGIGPRHLLTDEQLAQARMVAEALAATERPAAPQVPEGMAERIEAALQRIVDGHCIRRIPADPTDPDLVLAEVLAFIKGEPAPAWLATQPAPEQPKPALLTNPHTGQPRDYRDVESDPQGILIHKPGEPLRAAEHPTTVTLVNLGNGPQPVAEVVEQARQGFVRLVDERPKPCARCGGYTTRACASTECPNRAGGS